MKYGYEDVKKFIEENECLLISKENDYKDTETKLNIKCKCGNIFSTSFRKFKHRSKRQCNVCGHNNAIIKQQKQVVFNCDYCGKISSHQQYLYNSTKLHFCNKECRKSYETKGTQNVICESCGKKFSKIKSRIDNTTHHFCSFKCATEGRQLYQGNDNHPRWKGGDITFNCEVCNKESVQLRSVYNNSNHHYCSWECSNKGKTMFCSGENNLCYKRTKVNCEICNKEILMIDSKIKANKHIYCSNECCSVGKSIFYNGENSFNWNPNRTLEERTLQRSYFEYFVWRSEVFKKDEFKCQYCGNIGYSLNAHHLNGYHWDIEHRLDINNGATLCNECHKNFHSKYGVKYNTKEQFCEWMLNKNNI